MLSLKITRSKLTGERDIKAELTAHLSFGEENVGHLFGGRPAAETVEVKRNQTLEVILLIKNKIGFLKALRGITENGSAHEA